jgi:hypothetical protein
MMVDANDWAMAKRDVAEGHWAEVSVASVWRDGRVEDVAIAAMEVLYGADSARCHDWPKRGAEDILLFDGDWRPAPEMTVPQALRALADGASLREVSHPDFTKDRGALFRDVERYGIELSREVPEGMVL